jgi:hypothetical protein
MKNSLWQKAGILAALCSINVSVFACCIMDREGDGSRRESSLTVPSTRQFPSTLTTAQFDLLQLSADPSTPLRFEGYSSMVFMYKEISDVHSSNTFPIVRFELIPVVVGKNSNSFIIYYDAILNKDGAEIKGSSVYPQNYHLTLQVIITE